jgi:hypothetical protein
MNETFLRARTIFDQMLEESLAMHRVAIEGRNIQQVGALALVRTTLRRQLVRRTAGTRRAMISRDTSLLRHQDSLKPGAMQQQQLAAYSPQAYLNAPGPYTNLTTTTNSRLLPAGRWRSQLKQRTNSP